MLLASPTYPCNDAASQIVHLRHTLVNQLLGILATSGAYSAAAQGEQLPRLTLSSYNALDNFQQVELMMRSCAEAARQKCAFAYMTTYQYVTIL